MKWGIGCVAVVILAVVVVGLALMGIYNGLIGAEESVKSSWGQVENAYQRRADLIPNLVETVKGASDFEQETLNQIVEARSRVGQLDLSQGAEILSDPQKFARFQQAQDALSSALSRLLVVVERYPELKAVAAYRDLMVQLEGSENRISVERKRFNEAARGYNQRRRRFPANLLIGALGWDFSEAAYFEAQPGAETVPEVSFEG